jgi:hypothetical protein
MLRRASAVILAALFRAMPGFAALAQAQYNPMNETKANPKVVVPARPDRVPDLVRQAQYNPWKEIKAVPPARPEAPAALLRG